MTKVHVICGGTSDERAVSLRSGKAVATALEKAGYEVAVFDTSDSDDAIADCDVVFPVLHGPGGEDGEFQARLERLGAVYVGSDEASSRLCMDKASYRDAMIAAGILMAEGEVVDKVGFFASELVKGPFVLKPIHGGSSVDTLIVREPTTFERDKANQLFEKYPTMLLEKCIIGDELTVGMLGDEVLPVIEIIPPEGAEFDYDNKYNGLTEELCPPKNISQDIQTKAQAVAMAAHRAAGCRDMTRNDVMVDSEGTCYLLETNTIPGLTDQSLYPKMAAAVGLDMPALCDKLIGFALSRK